MQREITVEAVQGRLGGVIDERGIATFLGVPYGEIPPDGRFKRAQPVRSWSGVRACREIGPAAPQPDMDFGAGPQAAEMAGLMAAGTSTERRDEQCLVLNLWTPAPDGGARPVIVSIHGGAHTLGSGSMAAYPGASLAAAHDVVVVSPNHRLGALGYLYLADLLGDEYAESGNVGNLDLVAVLEWVRDNIAAFGGDPGNVTVMGESGGAGKISALLAMDDAAGLFHRAILQSGSKLRSLTTKAGTATAQAVLSHLGLQPADAGTLVTMPVADIVAAQLAVLGSPLGAGAPGGMGLASVVDGVVLRRHPFDPDAPAQSASIPLLIGGTKDEMTMFTYGDALVRSLDDDGADRFIGAVFGGQAPHIAATYRRTRPGATAQQRITAVMTDRFRVGGIRMAERKAAAGAAPAWMYRFDFETDAAGGALGAPHAMDIPFSFADPDVLALSGTRPERHEVARHLSGACVAFARTGNPQTSTLPDWPPYDPVRRATMLFDTTCTVVDDPDGEERQAWDGLPAGI